MAPATRPSAITINCLAITRQLINQNFCAPENLQRLAMPMCTDHELFLMVCM